MSVSLPAVPIRVWPAGDLKARRRQARRGDAVERDGVARKGDLCALGGVGEGELVEAHQPGDAAHIEMILADRKVGDGVVAPEVGEHEGVGAVAGAQRIVALAADERVAAAHIGAEQPAVADQGIGAAAAFEDVVAVERR